MRYVFISFTDRHCSCLDPDMMRVVRRFGGKSATYPRGGVGRAYFQFSEETDLASVFGKDSSTIRVRPLPGPISRNTPQP